jgi:hemin uptake protein HemP
MKIDDIKIIDTKMLFPKDSNRIEIIHNGVVYILRITKGDKLILTK